MYLVDKHFTTYRSERTLQEVAIIVAMILGKQDPESTKESSGTVHELYSKDFEI